MPLLELTARLFAQQGFDDPDIIEKLDPCEYDEERWIAIGLVEEVLINVVFAMRFGEVRLISAR